MYIYCIYTIRMSLYIYLSINKYIRKESLGGRVKYMYIHAIHLLSPEIFSWMKPCTCMSVMYILLLHCLLQGCVSVLLSRLKPLVDAVFAVCLLLAALQVCVHGV